MRHVRRDSLSLSSFLWIACRTSRPGADARLRLRLHLAAGMIHNTHMDEQPIPQEWRDEFDAAAARPFHVHMRYAFIYTYKPVMDDARYRSWESTADYRRWCNENLPDWLGYRSD